ncbi:heparinase II/III domain-containing protein [Larkinella punicea]|uniref:heparinase II/III domain-containing protein n=1 Tax=Larkinella punicea TaxID=2315727 RepID=UPI001CA3BF13|nr:heparinase II/III family protein [Larkinella punicea]
MFRLLAFILVFSFRTFAADERNLLQKSADVRRLDQTLILHQKWVTYPVYTDRAGWDKMTGSLKTSLIKKGEENLNYTWQKITASGYLEFERSGSRLGQEEPFNTNTVAFNHLVVAELAEGKGRFMDKIIDGVWFFCEQTSWASVNNLFVMTKNRPPRSLPNPDEAILDLVVGDMSTLLAWTHYFLTEPMDNVNPLISQRLRHELQRRILDPYMQRDDYWWQALKPTQTFVNNWNPWCNFNVLACYMLLENDPQKLAQAVARTMQSVDKFINYNHEDGGCEEGPFYWDLAAGKLYEYLALLHQATGGKVSIFDQPLIKNMGEYIVNSYIGNGWVVNFADAPAKVYKPAGMIYRYGKAVNSVPMQKFGAYLARQSPDYVNCSCHGSGRDLTRTLENLRTWEEVEKTPGALSTPPYSWYPQTELCFMRSGNYFLAAKGGHNGESHNHNDVGSFILFYKNKPLLIDVGVGTYTKQTFSNNRYGIWTMLSHYHSVPNINGISQKNGRKYRARNVRFDSAKKTFSLDLAEAYDSAGVQQWNRSFTLQPDGVGLVLRDAFVLGEVRVNNQFHFMCARPPDITEKGVVAFWVDGERLTLQYDPLLFLAEAEPIDLPDKRMSNVWGSQIYRLRLTALKTASKGTYSFTVTALK